MPMGMPVGGYSTMPMNYMAGVTGAAVWHADVRHADRPAWPAARAVGSSRRSAKARHREPHARLSAGADREDERIDVKQTPGIQLSGAGQPCPHRRAHQCRASGCFEQPLCDRHEMRRSRTVPDSARGMLPDRSSARRGPALHDRTDRLRNLYTTNDS